MKQEDIHAKYESGMLRLSRPKMDKKKPQYEGFPMDFLKGEEYTVIQQAKKKGVNDVIIKFHTVLHRGMPAGGL